jgi:hypothetical protein
MRKRYLTKQLGVVVSEETYKQLIDTTNRLEISVSQFIRESIEEKISLLKENEDV